MAGVRRWAPAALTGVDVPLPPVRDLGGACWRIHRAPVRGSLTGLCPTCVTTVDQAVARLPADVAELTTLLPRRAASSVPETSRIALSSPQSSPPMRLQPYDLRDLVDHEVTCWAAAVDRRFGAGWDTARVHRARMGARVAAGCLLLRMGLAELLDHPPLRYPARSLGEDPGAGHDPEGTTRMGAVTWCTRDGVSAGLLLRDLHRLVGVLAARRDGPRLLPMPCRNRGCGRRTLRHEPGSDEVVCTTCHARLPWATYADHRDELAAAVAAARG